MIPWLIFGAAMATAVLLTPLSRIISLRYKLLALPGGRRQHQGPIPTLGGLPVLGAYLAGILLIFIFAAPTGSDLHHLRGVIFGTLIVFVGGIVDDRFDLSPLWQFIIHLAAAGIAISHEVFIERFTNPFPTTAVWEWGPLASMFTIENSLVVIQPGLVFLISLFWILGMINTVNFLDGLDGLASGVGTIAMLLFTWHSFVLEQTTVPLFSLALAGGLIGFLFFNFAPARIFLGTAGAWILGYNIATLAILSPAKISTALLVMAVPILDVAWQIIDRLRRGQHPYQGDRGHLHFRLSDGGLPTRLIVFGYYLVAGAFGLVAILAQNALLKIILWLVLVAAVLALLVWLTRRARQSDGLLE